MTVEIIAVDTVITGVDAGGHPLALEGAAIAHADGGILAVGPRAEVIASWPEAPMRTFAHCTALPGLVNGHHHIGVTPFQHGMPDLPLEQWVIRRIAERGIDPYFDTLYSAFEMVASGVTTVLHLYANKLAGPDEVLADAKATIRAYQAIGMRVSFAIMFFDQNALGYVGDDVARDLDAAERTAAGAIATAAANMDFASHAAVLAELRHCFAGDERVRVQLAPANLQWCSHHSLERFAELAHDLAAPVHMHLLETHTQRAYANWRTGGAGPVAYLRGLGFAGPSVALGHGTWLDAADLEAVAEAGFSVCHNCSSNLRLSSGIAPVNALLAGGINVALGMDEAGINDDRDMLMEMRLALHLHKATDPERHPHGVGAGNVLRMATEGGARTTGFGDRIGRIAPGAAADFVIFDAVAASYPADPQAWPPLDILLHRGRPQHIRAVYASGRSIYADGVFPGIDRDAVLEEISAALGAAGPPDGARLASLERIEAKLRAAHAAATKTRNWYSR